MNNKVICEKCGTEMIPVDLCKPVGMTCPNCGWGWATTYIDPLLEDAALYTVSLAKGNNATKETIKAVAKISNKNILQAKRMIEESPVDIYVGKAVQVKDILNRLESLSIAYNVTPAFPYLLSKEIGNTDST